METVAIVNRKGGVGKTATAQALGAGLAKKGYKVLFIDLDSQTNLSYALAAEPDKPSSINVLTGEADAAQAIQQKEGGDIIAGSDRLARAEALIEDNAGKYYRLREALEGLKKKYDYCIIDTPAALGMVTMNCIIAANRIIVPVQADLFSVQGAERIATTLQTLKEQCGEKRKVDGYLLTRYNPRATISKSICNDLEQYAKDHGTKVYKTTIRECAALKEAELMQQSIFEYAPRSNGAKDYTEFINEFIG